MCGVSLFFSFFKTILFKQFYYKPQTAAAAATAVSAAAAADAGRRAPRTRT